MTDILRALMAEPLEEGESRGDHIGKRLFDLADGSDPEVALGAIKYIYDRLDGKPTESQEISGPGGKPLELQVVERIVARRNADS